MHVIGAAAQAAGAGGVLRHLLAVSTGLVYGAASSGPSVLGESEPLRGMPGYAFIERKVEADRQLMAVRGRLPIPLTVLRPSMILGPGDDGVMAHYLGARLVPTVWGYDPLVQLVSVCRRYRAGTFATCSTPSSSTARWRPAIWAFGSGGARSRRSSTSSGDGSRWRPDPWDRHWLRARQLRYGERLSVVRILDAVAGANRRVEERPGRDDRPASPSHP
jgi:hypothetical protein